jgi:hypothetical protein
MGSGLTVCDNAKSKARKKAAPFAKCGMSWALTPERGSRKAIEERCARLVRDFLYRFGTRNLLLRLLMVLASF